MLRADERTRRLEIDENELWILSYYRASELAGALVMGRLAGLTDDDDLRVNLTEHCAEEAGHAWLWTRTILEVGGKPLKVSETYQTRYYAETGPPTTVIEVLALTQVFERRVMKHFRHHLSRPGTHPAVARTLRQMIADEAGHIGWVKRRLDRCTDQAGGWAVAETLRRFVEVDHKVYAELLEYRDRFHELVDPRRCAEPGANGAGPRTAVERKTKEIVAWTLGVAADDLEPATPLSMLGMDSLQLVAMISAVEDACRIEISPADTAGLFTLADVIEKVTELVTRT
jgi:acyl carrier protein/rubrerythrin